MTVQPEAPAPPPAAAPAAHAGAGTGPVRSDRDRVVAGVCSGLGRWLSADPPLLRLLFAATSAIGGTGLLAYAALVIALPAEPEAPPRPLARRLARATGFAFQLAGALLLLSAAGLAPGPVVLAVATLATAGGALLWRAVADDQTGAASTPGGAGTSRARLASIARTAAGFTLLGAGAVLSLQPGAGSAGLVLIVAAVVAGGAVVVFAPSLRRARAEATAQRIERARADERAAVAAQLHDSVLQTLAVIQRLDDASPRVQGIARRQERELRSWLYGDEQPGGPETLASALRHAIEEVELLHGVAVDLVQPSDAPLDERSDALVQATREAIVNAAHHAGVADVSVLAHVTPSEVAVYVRDRGAGFDPGSVPDDRRGIRDSITNRMERAGGTAAVTSSPGTGTEVELRLPRDASGSGA